MTSCEWVYGLVLVGPALAWIYAVVVLIFLWAWHECAFFSMTNAITLRTALLAASLAVCTGLCKGEETTRLDVTVPISTVFNILSMWLIYLTRVNEVEGGIPPKLGADCMKDKVVLITGANAGRIQKCADRSQGTVAPTTYL